MDPDDFALVRGFRQRIDDVTAHSVTAQLTGRHQADWIGPDHHRVRRSHAQLFHVSLQRNKGPNRLLTKSAKGRDDHEPNAGLNPLCLLDAWS